MVKIIKAIPREDYCIDVVLDNGKIGSFNVSPYLDKGIFTELKDIDYFFQVKVRGRSIYWPHEQDFCADTIEAEMEEVLQDKLNASKK
jgi:hypothetical protein